MSDQERLIKRLMGLRKLALEGKYAGERDAAQKLFDKLLREHDFDLADFDDQDRVEIREFRYSGNEEERILMQTASKILDSFEINTWSKIRNKRKIAGLILFEVTREQEIEIKFLFDFYRELWKEEKKKMLLAFIQKHSLTPNTSNPDQETKLSATELLDLFKRMSVLSDADPVKRLETA